jgi:hypothetical protein
MDLQAEYDDFLNGLGDHGAAFFKFFELFKINLGDSPEDGMTKGLHYGKQSSDSSLSDEQLRSLKTYLKTRPTGHLTLRGGLGLGARDLSYKKGPDTFESSTPVSLVSLGADYYVNSRVSLGAEVSARNAMVSEGFDRSSYDATLRMDTHF